MKLIELEQDNFLLLIDREEARALAAITYHVGGSPTRTHRRVFSDLGDAMVEVKISPHDTSRELIYRKRTPDGDEPAGVVIFQK